MITDILMDMISEHERQSNCTETPVATPVVIGGRIDLMITLENMLDEINDIEHTNNIKAILNYLKEKEGW